MKDMMVRQEIRKREHVSSNSNFVVQTWQLSNSLERVRIGVIGLGAHQWRTMP